MWGLLQQAGGGVGSCFFGILKCTYTGKCDLKGKVGRSCEKEKQKVERVDRGLSRSASGLLLTCKGAAGGSGELHTGYTFVFFFAFFLRNKGNKCGVFGLLKGLLGRGKSRNRGRNRDVEWVLLRFLQLVSTP